MHTDALTFQSAAADANQRLDVFLAARIPGFSRARIQQLIEQGHVTVNGQPLKKRHRMVADEQVAVLLPTAVASTLLPENIPLVVLYEDADLIVIDKSAGQVVHPAPGHASGTLVNALLHHCGDLAGIGGERRPGIVHRLDKDTSGAMVAAKNEKAFLDLGHQFRRRTVQKDYVALVRGVPVPAEGRIEAALARHPRDRQRFAVTQHGGRQALTFYQVREAFGIASLLHIGIATGRTHQIRVHLAWRGHPVLGDNRYGGSGRLPDGTPIPRQMLHAWRLQFRHPVTGAPIDCTAPLPADLQAILARLRQDSST